MKLEKAFDNFIPFIPIIYLLLNFIPGFIYKIIFGIMVLASLLYKNSKEKIKFNKVNITIAYLFIYLILNFLFVGSQEKTSAILIIYSVFILFGIFNLVKKKQILNISKYLFIFSVFIITLSFYEVFTGNYHFLVNSEISLVSKETGLNYPIIFFNNYNDLAYLLIILFPFSIYALIKKSKKLLLLFMYTFIIMIIGFLTQSIFTILTTVVYLLFLFLSYLTKFENSRYIFKKYKKKVLILILILVTTIAIISMPVVILFFQSKIFTGRLDLLQQALVVIKNNVFFGVGVGGYKNFMTMPPHNLFLNMGISGGIMGIFPIVYLYIKIISSYLKSICSNFFELTIQNLIGLSILLFFITNMMSSQAEGRFITWLLLGLALVVFSDNEEQ